MLVVRDHIDVPDHIWGGVFGKNLLEPYRIYETIEKIGDPLETPPLKNPIIILLIAEILHRLIGSQVVYSIIFRVLYIPGG